MTIPINLFKKAVENPGNSIQITNCLSLKYKKGSNYFTILKITDYSVVPVIYSKNIKRIQKSINRQRNTILIFPHTHEVPSSASRLPDTLPSQYYCLCEEHDYICIKDRTVTNIIYEQIARQLSRTLRRVLIACHDDKILIVKDLTDYAMVLLLKINGESLTIQSQTMDDAYNQHIIETTLCNPKLLDNIKDAVESQFDICPYTSF